MTPAEMYQKVRDALAVGDGVAFMQLRMDAWGALAALETEERDAEESALLQEADTDCERIAQREDATPPAPPAAEAIAAAFARDFFVRHDHTYSGIEIYEWLKKQVTGPAAPPAAECAARLALEGCAAFFEEAYAITARPGGSVKAAMNANTMAATCNLALAAPCECQRLRDELAAANSEIARLTAKHREKL